MKISQFQLEQYEAPAIAYRWRDGLTGGKAGLRPQTMLRVSTDEGIDGICWLRDRTISEDLIRRCFEPAFLGADPFMREKIWYQVWERDRLEEFPMYALGYLDVALWDISAKAAGLPLYKHMGGSRPQAKAYASTVTVDTLDDYLRLADDCLNRGYQAIKLHVWGRLKDDIELVLKLRQHVGPDIELMLDGSAGYTYDESLRLGRAMEEADYLWLEEPMREFHLQPYQKLCRELDIPVLAAECTDGCHFNASEWVRLEACDRLRTSWFFKGGFTGALKTAYLAESFGMEADVHGCGPAALHLACAIPNTLYYESLVPEEVLPHPFLAAPIRPDADGWVAPDSQPGIGWEPNPDCRVN